MFYFFNRCAGSHGFTGIRHYAPTRVCTRSDAQFDHLLRFFAQGSRLPGRFSELFEIVEDFRELFLEFLADLGEDTCCLLFFSIRRYPMKPV